MLVTPGGPARFSGQKVLIKKKKKNSTHHLVGVRLTLPQSTFATAMSQSQ